MVEDLKLKALKLKKEGIQKTIIKGSNVLETYTALTIFFEYTITLSHACMNGTPEAFKWLYLNMKSLKWPLDRKTVK